MPDGSYKNRSQEFADGYRSLDLDALIGIGGDGSLKILRDLCQEGNIPFIGIPKTIDNDLGATETSVGYDTAVSVATEALDRLQPTAASHNRVMILEVMGRDAGHIALASGIAGGADVILIPEIEYDFQAIVNKINNVKKAGRNFALIVVAEAVKTKNDESIMIAHTKGQNRYGGIGDYVGRELSTFIDAEIRVTTLGHVQRGGMPTWNDRLLGSSLGVKAVELISESKFDRMVAWQNRDVVDVPLLDAISSYRSVDVKGGLLKTAKGLGICMGD